MISVYYYVANYCCIDTSVSHPVKNILAHTPATPAFPRGGDTRRPPALVFFVIAIVRELINGAQNTVYYVLTIYFSYETKIAFAAIMLKKK